MSKFVTAILMFLATSFSHGMCFNEAASYYNVNPQVLYAIAKHESRLNRNAVNRNSDGSYDIGVMQINTVWLPELNKIGIRYEHLFDPCTNVYVGAWIYAKKVRKYGNTWNAVGAYHSETAKKKEKYSWIIFRQIYGG